MSGIVSRWGRSMPRFRKRPIIVEAEQWFDGKPTRGVHGGFPNSRKSIACYPEGCYEIHGPSVVTIHGQVTPIVEGTWVVAESDGVHFYPVTDEEFRRIYEPVP
jgi:hypothetical protein